MNTEGAAFQAELGYPISAAQSGKELSAVIRHVNAGTAAPQELFVGLAKMLVSPASTPLDALAYAAAARKIMPEARRLFAEVEDDPKQALALNLVSDLLNRAVEALEISTGVRADTFTGAPAPN